MSIVKPWTPEEDEVERVVPATNPMGLPLKELRRLKDQFQDASGQPKKLNQEQFVKALSASRPSKAKEARENNNEVNELKKWKEDLEKLFKKIDASCTNTVDWEEFTNYMLFHFPGFNSGDASTELAHGTGLDALAGAWGSGHSDMINSIAIIYDSASNGPNNAERTGSEKGTKRFVTAGRDGFIKVWNPNLTLHRAVNVGQHSSWLSSCCWMPKSKRLAVASSCFSIYFYDSSFSVQAAGPIAHLVHNEGTPLCLGYTESNETDGSEKEILMVGDDNGCVTVYPMDQDWMEHDNKADLDASKDKESLKVKNVSRKKYHRDWVTKVGYVSEIQAIVTSSLDGEISLINERKAERDVVKLHKKGVHSWCWCKNYRLFASGGIDRQIIIWDVHSYSKKAQNYLQGHNATVLDLMVNEEQHQLISMSVDKVVKVWDLRNCQCIQTFTDKTEYKPEDRLTCMAFDEDGPALILCSSMLNVLPVSVKVETCRTHVSPIVGALYNDVFQQVITGDNLGTVSVWDVDTGKLEFEFKRAHEDRKMTCMAFDQEKRRLYTGSECTRLEDGAVKLWNLSSGQQLRTFTLRQPSEITSLFWARGDRKSVV